MINLDTPNRWSSLLLPIDSVHRCGVDLQYEEKYDSIRRDRQPPGSDLPTGVWDRELKKVDYDSIAVRCVTLLEKETKDIQLLGWLLEAKVMANDLEGAAQATHLLYCVIAEFWDDLFPLIDLEDLDLRMGPIKWVIRESMKWFAPTESLAVKNPKNDNVSSEKWIYLKSQFESIEKFLLSTVSDSTPMFRDLLELLEVGLSSSKLLGDDAGHASLSKDDYYLGSRDAAYEKLSDISIFLARIEPHSPVPMVLDALVGWRGNSFEDLLLRLPAQGGASVYDLLKLFRPDAFKK